MRPVPVRGGEELAAARLALTFLTVLPLPGAGEVPPGRFARATAYYPLAGYAVGGLAALVLLLPLPPPVAAALALALWWLLTGLLHLDGLIDSADALLAPVSPARRLEILQDVHVGAFGVAAAALTTLLAWAALSAVTTVWAPVVAAVLARTVLLAPLHLWPTARAGGLGDRAARSEDRSPVRRPGWRPVLALALAAPTVLLPGAWFAWLVVPVVVLVVAAWAARRLGGGLTGDAYGLLVVVGEVTALLALTVRF